MVDNPNQEAPLTDEEAGIAGQVHLVLENLRNITDFVNEARLGKALIEVMASTAILTIDHDLEDDSYRVVSMTEGRRHSHAAATLLSAIECMFSTEKTRRCRNRACRKVKPLSQFVSDPKFPEGRRYVCKACESARITQLKKAKNEARKREQQGQQGH